MCCSLLASISIEFLIIGSFYHLKYCMNKRTSVLMMKLEISENGMETSCGPRKPLDGCMFHPSRAMLDFPAAALAFHVA